MINRYSFLKKGALTLVVLSSIIANNGFAQQLNSSLQFREGERMIRIAEPGMLADSINVWGDLSTTGKFLVPKNTYLIDLLSYAGGMVTLRDGQTNLDWSRMRVEVYIHSESQNGLGDEIMSFKYRFEEPFPDGMWEYKVENNQAVIIRVKRKPSFRDYLGVFASTVSAVAATIILLDRLNGSSN